MHMIKKIVRRLLGSLGYEIHSVSAKKITEASIDESFGHIVGQVRSFTMLSSERLYSLYRQVKYCEQYGVEGAFVECGVWKGGAVALMALTNLAYSKKLRDIHLFDAFDHICEPDKNIDGQRAVDEMMMWARNDASADGRLVPLQGFYDQFGGAGSLEDNRKLLEERVGYDPVRLNFHKGWFQDTLPADAGNIGNIAILRVDADWYASTKVCLEHLFDKVVSGGFVIVDDYGAYDGCRKAVDEFLAAVKQPMFINWIDNEAIYFIVP